MFAALAATAVGCLQSVLVAIFTIKAKGCLNAGAKPFIRLVCVIGRQTAPPIDFALHELGIQELPLKHLGQRGRLDLLAIDAREDLVPVVEEVLHFGVARKGHERQVLNGVHESQVGVDVKLAANHPEDLSSLDLLSKVVIDLLFVGNSITERGVGYLETVLRTNVSLKYVVVIDGVNHIPTGPGIKWNKIMYWLGLNRCSRKLLKEPNATPTQWRDTIIQSSEAENPDAVFMFLTNKPEWCMM